MKLSNLCLVALATTVLAGCDQPSDGSPENLEFRGRDTKNCAPVNTIAVTSLSKSGIPNDDPFSADWLDLSAREIIETSRATLGGTVRYRPEVAESCPAACAEAGFGDWDGNGCMAEDSFANAEVVGEVETRYGLLPLFQVDIEGELGCTCNDRR